jgi:hypothetical protein
MPVVSEGWMLVVVHDLITPHVPTDSDEFMLNPTTADVSETLGDATFSEVKIEIVTTVFVNKTA